MLVITSNLEQQDAGVRLAQIAQATGAPWRLLIPDWVPNWRRRAHQYGLPISACWSLYDDLQSIELTTGIPLLLDDLGLPLHWTKVDIIAPDGSIEGVSYWDDMTLIAKAEIYADGRVHHLTRYAEGRPRIRQDYDARGFCSRRLHLAADGTVRRTVYLSIGGDPVFTVDAAGMMIKNGESRRFDAVAAERIMQVLTTLGVTRLVTVPTAGWQRLRPYLPAEIRCLVPLASGQTIARRNEHDRIVTPPGCGGDVILPTIATHWQPGRGQQLATRHVIWSVGDLPMEKVEQITGEWVEDAEINTDTVIHIAGMNTAELGRIVDHAVGTATGINLHSHDYARAVKVLSPTPAPTAQIARKLAERAGISAPDWQQLAKAYDIRARLVVEPSIDGHMMAVASAVIDTGSHPNEALRFGAVSAGVPLLGLEASDLLEDGANGRLVTTDNLVVNARDYLDDLLATSKVFIASATIVKTRTPAAVLAKWKEALADGNARGDGDPQHTASA